MHISSEGVGLDGGVSATTSEADPASPLQAQTSALGSLRGGVVNLPRHINRESGSKLPILSVVVPVFEEDVLERNGDSWLKRQAATMFYRTICRLGEVAILEDTGTSGC